MTDATHVTVAGAFTGERPSAFGPLVSAHDVEQAVLAQLQKWLANYVWEIERQHGLTPGGIAEPRSWSVSSEVEKFPEDQLPAVIVASAGITDPPLADGGGRYTARFEVDVAIHLAARGNRLAMTLARHYAAAVRACGVQQQRLPGVAVRRIDWIDERYDRLPSIDERTVCVGRVTFAIEVEDITRRHHGPLEPLLPPDAEPGPDSPSWPIAELIDVELDKRPIDGPLNPQE